MIWNPTERSEVKKISARAARSSRRSSWIGLALVSCLSPLVGCGSSGPELYSVSGEVQFDGQPLEAGEILFRATDGAQGSAAGAISAGRYELQSTPGPKRVEIVATRQIDSGGPAPSGEPALRFQVILPPRYHSASELTAEVTPDGANRFDFDLQP